jgi:hypothetical protein
VLILKDRDKESVQSDKLISELILKERSVGNADHRTEASANGIERQTII